jgi:hypothetical protein
MVNFSKLPENEENEPKPDANQQPPLEQEHTVHRPKVGASSRDGKRRPVSLFQPGPASSPLEKS